MKRVLTIAVSLVFLTVALPTLAGVPAQLNYQGRLTDDLGASVADGSYNISFSIYDVAVGGSALWTEAQLVTVSDGLFAVSLGLTTSIDPTMFENPDLWMGITIEANPEFVPRTKFETNPYAFQAQTVALNSIDSLHIIDNSITAVDILNEPGLAWNYSSTAGDTIPLDNSIAVLRVDTIDCPTDGYVVVFGDFDGIIDYDPALDPDIQYVFGIGLDSTAFYISALQWTWEPTGSIAPGIYRRQLSIKRVIPVVAGSHDFFLIAQKGTPANVVFRWAHPSLILMFFPTLYETN
jgi:hypothetical protein